MITRQRTTYKGEWCRSLYSEDGVELGKAARGISLFDIELPIRGTYQYDEGVRKTEEEVNIWVDNKGNELRSYRPGIVGTGSAQRLFFRCLTQNETLEDTEILPTAEQAKQDRYGKLVNSAPYTFYQLLEKYYSERET